MITDEQNDKLKELIKQGEALKSIQATYNKAVSKFIEESGLTYGAYIFYRSEVRKKMNKEKV